MRQSKRRDKANAERRLPLVAYPISPLEMPLMVAPASREWMGETHRHFAKRCLPLMIANRAGWLLISMHTFTAIWDGNENPSGVKIQYQSGKAPFPASSHFGSGIVTFDIPFLFRTPPGINLLVRGPANFVKDGIAPLEGIVETDWSEATFTMNWKLTRPNNAVMFKAGEPIAMIVPQRRGDLERFDPVVRDIATDQALMDAYVRWMESRAQHNAAMADQTSDAYRRGWEGNYFHGKAFQGNSAAEDHQRKITLKDFVEDPPPKT